MLIAAFFSAPRCAASVAGVRSPSPTKGPNHRCAADLQRTRRSARAFATLPWLACACLVAACGSHEAGLGELAAAFAPHRESFARFDRWARQLQGSDVSLRSRAALAEATFAPLRGQSDVLAARVTVFDRSGEGAPVVSGKPLELPEGCEWPAHERVTIRDAQLGAIDVAELGQCGFGRSSPEKAHLPCIIVSKRVASSESGALLEVRVAYRSEQGSQ
jgi:hypothetical protein